jgi:hypothetical protein
MKLLDKEGIITIVIIVAAMFLIIFIFEMTCGSGNRYAPFYTDCSNVILFHPKFIGSYIGFVFLLESIF